MLKTIKNEMNVSFDEYQRYKNIAEIIDFFRQDDNSKIFTILEIGSNEHKYLSDFLPNDKILFTDIVLTEKMQQDKDFQQADGTNLSFVDKSFDFVVAADVLEHIYADSRYKVLAEAYRVAKISAIFAFPYQSADVNAAEKRLNTFYKAISGEDYIWLQEHIANGLPEISDINVFLNNLDCNYFHFLHGDIKLWETLNYHLFSALFVPESWEYFRQIDAYYMEHLYAGDTSLSCYRAIYVIAHDDLSLAEKYANEKYQTLDNNTDFWQVLFHAHDIINALHERVCLQKVLNDKDGRIAYLEAENKEIRERWEKDVSLWQRDVNGWQNDAKKIEYLEAVNTEIKESWARDVDNCQKQVDCLQNEILDYKKQQQLWQQDEMHLQIELQTIQASWKNKYTKLYQLNDSLRKELEYLKQQNNKLSESIIQVKADKQQIFSELCEVQKAYECISEAFFWKISRPIRVALDWLKNMHK